MTVTEPLRVTLDQFNTVAADIDKPRHSWTPSSLLHLAQNPPAPPTIGNILYPGKRTLLSGETESLKTWLALILAKAEMEIEQPVAWVDLDDMGAGAILQRLRALHVPDSTIDEFFLFYQPEQRLKDQLLDDVLMGLTVTGTRLMIIDAFNPILNLHGLDPNSTPDIETFWREIADPIARTGTAPVLLDHVAKNAESRGKYSYGSERKASGATVHIGTHTLNALAIGTTGRTLLTTHKDRPGYLPRPTIGILSLESDGENISFKLDPDKSHETGAFRPTVLMERISRRLEELTEPVHLRWVRENVQGNAKALTQAVAALAESGYLQERQGARNTRHLTSLKPYREADDDYQPSGSSPVPERFLDLGPFGSSSSGSSVPPPLGGNHWRDDTTQPKNHGSNPVPVPSERLPYELLLDTEPEPDEDAGNHDNGLPL